MVFDDIIMQKLHDLRKVRKWNENVLAADKVNEEYFESRNNKISFTVLL